MNGADERDPAPNDSSVSPVSPEERRADRRTIRNLVIWFCVCATIAAFYLVFAIWVDWV